MDDGPGVALLSSPEQVQDALETALDQLGAPYHYGGDRPGVGFDCSGLVHYSYAQAGITLPRTVSEQYRWVQPVSGRSLRPGDLVFFRPSGKVVSHVGIYLSNGRFIHAPKQGQRVGFADLASPYWREAFIGAGRVVAG